MSRTEVAEEIDACDYAIPIKLAISRDPKQGEAIV